MLLVRNQGFKNFRADAAKNGGGENPAAEMIKRFAHYCWFAAFITGFFTDFLGLALITAGAKSI
ncbi:FxsA family protein [Shigella flexneri]